MWGRDKGIGYDLGRRGRNNVMKIIITYTIISIFLGKGGHVNASIHEYMNDGFIPRFNSFFFHGGSEGLFASKPPPPHHQHPSSDDKSLNGKSFIRFESITFRRPKESASKQNAMQQRTGLVEAIVVEVKDRDKIGKTALHSSTICCTPELAKEGLCKVGEVIIRHDPDKPEWPKRIQTFFEGNDEEAKMVLGTIDINATGMYYLYFVICDPQLQDTVLNGRTVWRNPDGYLPGKMAPLMTFFGLMSLAYLVLGLVWFIKFLKCWKDVIQLHYHITAVIGLGMTEMALWYFEYSNFNSTGKRPMGITTWAVTFSAVKKSVARVLILVVSMGYGVVRPTLAGITSKVLLLGVLFFMATQALELVQHLGNINDLNGKVQLFFVLPVVLLDAVFIFWIFSSLSKTLEKLQIRKSMVKLELYRKFTNSLAVAVLLSVVWIGYELYFNASDPLSEMWQRAWIIPAFWALLSYALLVVICILFAPSHNQTRYAYGEDAGEDIEEESISLTSSGVKVGGGGGDTKLERKDRKPSVGGGLDHFVALPADDVQEDKRE
uniref:GOST seven transmembrane domain-containing protein n=1 Tax=Opuntia streptacantha TaxID=393608 RepID=A0A7C9DQL9_OPUST